MLTTTTVNGAEYGCCYLTHLLSITDRAGLLERMQSLDPNGVYSDCAADAEGMDPMTLEEGQAIVKRWLADCS